VLRLLGDLARSVHSDRCRLGTLPQGVSKAVKLSLGGATKQRRPRSRQGLAEGGLHNVRQWCSRILDRV
jgi:hypothetical protein